MNGRRRADDQVVLFLLEHPGASRRDVARALDVSPRAVRQAEDALARRDGRWALHRALLLGGGAALVGLSLLGPADPPRSPTRDGTAPIASDVPSPRTRS